MGRRVRRARRRGVGALTAVTAVTAVIAGCGADEAVSEPSLGGPTSATSAAAAVIPGRDSNHDALWTGVLRADRSSGCVWFDDLADITVQVLLAGAFEIDFESDPVVIYRDGDLFATTGAAFSGGGGMETAAGVPGCPVDANDGRVLILG